MSSREQMKRDWEREQAARVENTDDDVLALADEIYADMRATQVARVRGERQKGALVGLGFKVWIGPWGAYAAPERPSAVARILNSLRHKPYAGRLAAIGIVGHPQRNVAPRAEWLTPYCRIDTSLGTIHWGLADTRERAEVFRANYDVVELRVWDHGEIVAKVQSEAFDNGSTFTELALDDDDYRFEVGARNLDWGYSGKWFDWAFIDGQWRELEAQGRGWLGEWEGSTRTHTGEERIVEPSARERAIAYTRRQRIERENRQHGPVAATHGRAEVTEMIATAKKKGDALAARYWQIVERIQDDLAAAQKIDEEQEDSGVVDSNAEVIAYIEGIRDNPPNRAVRGHPVHIRKWDRALATLGVDTGERPWAVAEIRARAHKWPDSPWARVAAVLESV